ncbi:hypothetical protein TNCV_3052231 [Trichonephila clavipes]|nr:hypothetical protein TNCV_3052231 [Trichonephila clavipes]
MQEETMDRWGRSCSPRCTTASKFSWIVCMEEMDRATTSRIKAQHIQSVEHHSVFARTIRRNLLQRRISARRYCFFYS